MYKPRKAFKTQVKTTDQHDVGEPIETKVERLLANKEPINDGAPEIFTPRKDGVLAAYNIRTDRWEIAAEAMDKISASIDAKRDNVIKMDTSKQAESKTNDSKKNNTRSNTEKGGTDNVGGAESTPGEVK